MSAPSQTPATLSSPDAGAADVAEMTEAGTTESTRATETMRAIVFDDYGDSDVLHLRDHPRPRRSSGQVLIEVHACSVNPIDYRTRRGEMKRVLLGGFPRIPGYDVAGIVIECDAEGSFRPGERVMAFLDHVRGGGYADYAVCSETSVAKIPDAMSFEEAAAIPLAGSTALQSLRDHGKIRPGQRVLINGASGGVGMFAVQIAKAYQCHVDAVASGANEPFCVALGADRFIDYQKADFTRIGEPWDLIFDAAGKSSYWDARPVLNPGGRFVSTEPNVQGMLMTLLTLPLSKSCKVMLAKPNGDDLRELIALYKLGQLNVTIDRRYPLEQAAEAQRRVEAGVDRGKVVLSLSRPLKVKNQEPGKA